MRKDLAPRTHEAFEESSRAVFANGAIPEQTKQLIAVSVAHTDPMSLLHKGPYSARLAQRCQPGTDHRGFLGRRRDARERGLRARDDCPPDHGQIGGDADTTPRVTPAIG